MTAQRKAQPGRATRLRTMRRDRTWRADTGHARQGFTSPCCLYRHARHLLKPRSKVRAVYGVARCSRGRGRRNNSAYLPAYHRSHSSQLLTGVLGRALSPLRLSVSACFVCTSPAPAFLCTAFCPGARGCVCVHCALHVQSAARRAVAVFAPASYVSMSHVAPAAAATFWGVQ